MRFAKKALLANIMPETVKSLPDGTFLVVALPYDGLVTPKKLKKALLSLSGNKSRFK